jgi:NADH-quinone oxidoreductase subunit F
MPRAGADAEIPRLQLGRERAGTCHDRDILRYNPHALVEGSPLESYAIGATVAYNYIRGEFMAEPIPRFEAALEEAYAAGCSARTSGAPASIATSTPSSAPAPTSAARRRRCSSRSRASKASRASSRRSPRTSVLYGAPTTINNTQSVASIPTILRKGGQWFADLGCEGVGRHRHLLDLGPRRKTGNYEIRSASRSPSCSQSRAACAAGAN